jgi:hypothetical protein
LTSHPEILDLLVQYIDIRGGGEQWLTVQEFRRHFKLNKNSSPIVSGILQNLPEHDFLFSLLCGQD